MMLCRFGPDLYHNWKEHGIQAIRECRETRPSDYLRIVALIVSKAEDLSGIADGRHDHEIEAFIEERRQQALKMIARMGEEPTQMAERAEWRA
jgi:hypothetical protein